MNALIFYFKVVNHIIQYDLNNCTMINSTLRKNCFVIFTLFLVACSKTNIEPHPIINNKVLTSEIFSTASFEELNNAIVRFDPLYLQVMYKDHRTIAQIQEQSTFLIVEITKNPNNIKVQNELIQLYHFDSFADLQKASILISSSAEKFRSSYDNKRFLSVEQKQKISIARKLFIKNRIIALEEASQKRATGLWNDMVDEILRDLHYWTLVQNEELEISNTGSEECKDACCYEYKACLTRAASAYRVNFLTLGATMAAAGGSLGALYGSVIPFIGTATVGTGGGIIGGVAGFIQSVNVYLKDQEACVYSYKACTIRQNQK
jgi:hypothetical protein